MSESPPDPRPGRAFAVYSVLRLTLLVVVFAVLRLIVGDGYDLLLAGAAVLLSALLSLVLLRPQRQAFTTASLARAEQRRALKQARRSRLEEPEAEPHE